MLRRVCSAVLATAAVVTASPVAAQEKPGTIAMVIVTRVKPGMTKQYVEGRKRHMAWHKRQGDLWSWHNWVATAGPDTGSFLTVTFGHHWKDIDGWNAKYAQGDDADVELNLTPYVESTTVAYYDYLADLSRPPASQAPSKMSEVLHFMVKPGKTAVFRNAINRIHEAIGKTGWPVNYFWYELVNGGEGPRFVLVLPRNSWAEMAEPETPFPAMLTKAFGPFEAGEIMKALGESEKSQSSEMLEYRADLSYVATP
jgi:hypothetical protein